MGLFFPFISETGTKVQCHVSSCQLSGTDRACKARAGHSLTIRATLCYSSLTPSPWLIILPASGSHLLSQDHPAVLLPDPACQAEMFGISCKITTSCVWWGRARNTRTKQGALKEMVMCLPARFSAGKKQPNTEVSFLPHSLTQKKASQLPAFTCQDD